jgi:hypothetical protein
MTKLCSAWSAEPGMLLLTCSPQCLVTLPLDAQMTRNSKQPKCCYLLFFGFKLKSSVITSLSQLHHYTVSLQLFVIHTRTHSSREHQQSPRHKENRCLCRLWRGLPQQHTPSPTSTAMPHNRLTWYDLLASHGLRSTVS